LKLSQIILNLTGLALFLIPLVYAKIFYNCYDFPKMMVLYVLGAVLLLLSALDQERSDQPGQMARFIFAYLIWLSLSVLLSKAPHVNFFGLYLRFQGLFFFIFSIYFFFLGRRFRNERNYLIYAIVLAGVIVAALAIREFWNGAIRAGSTQGNADLLSNYLVLIIPCLLGLVFQSSRKWVKGVWLAGFFIALLGLHFSFSRSGWAGLIFVLFLFILFNPEIIKKRPKLAAAVVSLLILSVITTVILIRFQPGGVILKNPDRLEQIQKSPVVDQPRMAMIGLAWRVFWDHPVTGVGLNSLPVAVTRYLPAWLSKNNPTLMWDQVHNEFFHVLATQGLGGGIFYLTLLILLFRKWLRWWKLGKKEPLAAGIWVAIAGHLLLLQFGFPSAGYTLIFWFLIGVTDGATPVSVSQSPRRPLKNQLILRTVKISAAFLLLTATLYFVTGYIRADLAYMDGQRALRRKDYPGYERYLQKAIALAPWEDHYRFEHAGNLYLMLKATRLKPEQFQKYGSQLIKELSVLIGHSPKHFLYYNLIAETYAMYGMKEPAEQNFMQVIRLFPNFYPGYARLGDFMLKNGRKAAALRYYRKALKLNPDYQMVKSRLKQLALNEK
jgi:tetratricopeptide (TPR) repeat protein